jgi:hypothetical protein
MMNKKVYVGVYAGSLVLFLLAGILTLTLISIGETFTGARREIQSVMTFVLILASLAAFQFLVVYIVYQFLLLAKMWGAIQDGHARATPGKAIGFLFIPFFNIYWIFVAWGGFPSDYNKLVARHRLPIAPLSPTLYYLFPVFVLLSSLSMGLTFFINLFILLAITIKTANALNVLALVKQSNQRPPSQIPNPASQIPNPAMGRM